MLSTPVNKQIAYLPASPGVYLYKDDRGKIIYVGKAGNLRKRVKQSFIPPGRLPVKVQQLVASIRDLDFIVTDSEQEALILENNLIKKYKPLYNVSLKDDKSFPYLKIDINSPWPNICNRSSRGYSGYTEGFKIIRSYRSILTSSFRKHCTALIGIRTAVVNT